MAMIAWIFLFLLDLVLLCWLSAVYFRMQRGLKLKAGAKYRAIEYAIFVPFIFVLLPASIFLPAWLAETISIGERTENSTIIFLCVGILVLAISIIYGWNKSKRDVQNLV